MSTESKKTKGDVRVSPQPSTHLSKDGAERRGERDARLGAALRANLRRRKGQAQVRTEQAPPPPGQDNPGDDGAGR